MIKNIIRSKESYTYQNNLAYVGEYDGLNDIMILVKIIFGFLNTYCILTIYLPTSMTCLLNIILSDVFF